MMDHFWGYGGWGMPFYGMWPLFLLIIAILAFLAFRRNRPGGGSAARDILDRRYASGEVNKDQYEQMKRDLAAG